MHNTELHDRLHEPITKTIGGKSYIVRSVFLETGDMDIQKIILNIAERKAARDMGLDVAIVKNIPR